MRSILAIALVLLTGIVAGGYLFGVPQARALDVKVTADFQRGQADLEAGKLLLQKASTDFDPTGLATAVAKIRSARTHFQAAGDAVNGNPALVVASYASVPYLGPRLTAVRNLAAMGVAICDAAEAAAKVDGKLMASEAGAGNGTAQLLTFLKNSRTQLTQIRDDFARASDAAAAVDVGVLPAADAALVVSARNKISTGLADVDKFASLLPALYEILGANGKRTYVVEELNPAELRAGGGFIGSISLMDADNGKMSLIKTVGVETIDGGNNTRPTIGQPGYVAPPSVMRDFIDVRSFETMDSNFYPDFPTSAKTLESFSSHIGVKPDGVISIDPQAIAILLGLSGPIKVPGYDLTISQSNFVELAFDTQDGFASTRLPNHKDFLGAAAGPLIQALMSLPARQWGSLLSALNTAATQRHLQVYFNSPTAQQTMESFGWGGLLQVGGDFMYPLESNFGATKANHFTTRHYTVTLTKTGNTLHHSVVIDFLNTTPRGLPDPNYYRCYFRYYAPASATNLKITAPVKGSTYPDHSAPPGLQMVDGWFQVDVSNVTHVGTWKMSLEYDTPWTADAQDNHSIYWQKQPGLDANTFDVVWATGGHTYHAAGDMLQDRVLKLAPNGVTIVAGTVAGAQLPQLGF
jgi:hypothetical protein